MNYLFVHRPGYTIHHVNRAVTCDLKRNRSTIELVINEHTNHQFAIPSIYYQLLKVGGYHLSMPCHAGSCLCNASTR